MGQKGGLSFFHEVSTLASASMCSRQASAGSSHLECHTAHLVHCSHKENMGPVWSRMTMQKAPIGEEPDEFAAVAQEEERISAVALDQARIKSPKAIICTFIALPGMHKSALAKSLANTDGPALKDVPVEVISPGALKQGGVHIEKGEDYWAHVVDASSPGKVVVAAKLLVPSTHNHIRNVIKTLRSRGSPALAIVLTWRGEHVEVPSCPTLPWPVELVALCMLTRLKKLPEPVEEAQRPVMELDPTDADPLTSVVRFAAYFRDLDRPALLHLLHDQGFTHVVPVAVADLGQDMVEFTDLPQERQELLMHIATGLKDYNISHRPGLFPGWEAEVKALLEKPANKAWLESLALPLEESMVHLVAELCTVLQA